MRIFNTNNTVVLEQIFIVGRRGRGGVVYCHDIVRSITFLIFILLVYAHPQLVTISLQALDED